MAAASDDAVFAFSTEAVSVGRDRAATSLVARFFFPEPKPARLIQATLSNIFGLVRALTVIELGFNLHQLFFSTREAMQRGLPPVCFRCGRLGHHHNRCPLSEALLDLEARGPWISLPTGSYRRVNPFTLQPDGPSSRPREDQGGRSAPSSGFNPRPSFNPAPLLALPPASRPRAPTRSEASVGMPLPMGAARPNRHPMAGQTSGMNLVALGKRAASPTPSDPRRKSSHHRPALPPSPPASPDSVGSSTAPLPPGFHGGATRGSFYFVILLFDFFGCGFFPFHFLVNHVGLTAEKIVGDPLPCLPVVDHALGASLDQLPIGPTDAQIGPAVGEASPLGSSRKASSLKGGFAALVEGGADTSRPAASP
ncbi:hypothetical protein LINGRAHAP2_LOCUS36306 [Linum grandiflorum]